MSNVTIISDGTGRGTKIKVGAEYMSGVMRVEIDPITPTGIIRVKFTVNAVALRMSIVNADSEHVDNGGEPHNDRAGDASE